MVVADFNGDGVLDVATASLLEQRRHCAARLRSQEHLTDDYFREPEQRNVWRRADRHQCFDKFRSGGKFRFRIVNRVLGCGQYCHGCRRRHLLDCGQPGRERYLRGGSYGDAEFHGESADSDDHLWAAEQCAPGGCAVHNQRKREFRPGSYFLFGNRECLYRIRQHCHDSRRGHVLHHRHSIRQFDRRLRIRDAELLGVRRADRLIRAAAEYSAEHGAVFSQRNHGKSSGNECDVRVETPALCARSLAIP